MRLRLVPLLALVCLAPLVTGCGVPSLFSEKPPATVPNVPRETSVDPARAAALINAHRAAHGLAPLTVDPALNRIAAQTASELARRDTLKTQMHTAAGLGRRFDDAGYDAERGAENLGAGYPTLALAMEGWKSSSRHDRNLLNEEMTHMGIGLALTDAGQFHSYWVLLLARPAGAP